MATIVMDSQKVIDAAEFTINDIRARRLAEDESNIAFYIARNKPKGIFKKLGFKPPTREQAIKKLSEDGWSFFPCIRGYGTLEKCEKLRKLAQHGDPVTLNEEDIHALF